MKLKLEWAILRSVFSSTYGSSQKRVLVASLMQKDVVCVKNKGNEVVFPSQQQPPPSWKVKTFKIQIE